VRGDTIVCTGHIFDSDEVIPDEKKLTQETIRLLDVFRAQGSAGVVWGICEEMASL
jgi:hypothetical protein